jgi:hypothetical protein
MCLVRTRQRGRASRGGLLGQHHPPGRALELAALVGYSSLFPGGADPGYGAAHGGAAHRDPRDGFHRIAALSEGGVGALLEILLQERSRLLVELRGRSMPLIGAIDSPFWPRLRIVRLRRGSRRRCGMAGSWISCLLRLKLSFVLGLPSNLSCSDALIGSPSLQYAAIRRGLTGNATIIILTVCRREG